MKQILVLLCSLLLFVYLSPVTSTAAATVSPQVSHSPHTQECLECHSTITPGIVEDWLSSRHAQTSPEVALNKPKVERRVSSDLILENLKPVTVGCYECHSLSPENHRDNFDHFEYSINAVVSPNDCKVCHSAEAEQYSGSKKAHALGNLEQNPVYHTLVETISSVKEVKDNKVSPLKASENTKNETCYACHGTKVTVIGMKQVSTDLGDIAIPDLANWPNQGVGRINPDGSLGACTACHPRHSFSIEIARKPYTCSQCHLQPDVPAWEVYKESKHANIFSSKQDEWNWNHVPWRVGKDFRTPTCAVCHNSLITAPDGEIIISRTHHFGARLWVRLFGLIYSHPQPKRGETYLIKNKDNLPLPTTFKGELASAHLIEKPEQLSRQTATKQVCKACHSADWTNKHFTKLDATVAETDKMVFAATQLLFNAWDIGLAERSNPFDEGIEQKWIEQWLFYANSVRYASAMGGSPDYATFNNGWWALTHNLEAMKDFIGPRRKETR